MSFTIRDIFYIIIIILCIYFFNKALINEKVKCRTSVESLDLQNRIAEAELLKRNKIMDAEIENLNRDISILNKKKEEILNKNKILQIEIQNIKKAYEERLLYIDTIGINEAVIYWTDELRFRRH